MRCKVLLAVVALAFLAGAGCSKGESEAEMAAKKQAARADSVRIAEEMFDASAFDTLTWESDSARVQRGAVVWSSSCIKCHGANGGGNGEVAVQFELEVPSFMVPDWEYDGDIDGLRHRVFVGYSGDMPNWGMVGLNYRNIDAVAAYIADRMGPATADQQTVQQ